MNEYLNKIKEELLGKQLQINKPIQQKVVAIAFSKDRPMQLDCLLQSMIRHCTDFNDINVNILYLCSNDDYKRGYGILIEEYKCYSNIHFVYEYNFREQVLELLKLNEYVLWLVDDNIFVRDFDVATCWNLLEKHINLLGFSFCYGRNTNYCYMLNRPQTLPEFKSIHQGISIYNWVNADADFGYPLQVSSSIYSTKDLLPILLNTRWHNPNTIEPALNDNKLWFKNTKPMLLCFDLTISFCNPINLVQTQWLDNRVGNNMQYSSELLLKQFINNLRIDTSAFDNLIPISAHQEVELSFITKTDDISTPLVSVIIPLYNYEKYVIEAIDSVVKQTYKNWELIIVDDCSTDDSYNVVKNYIKTLQNAHIYLYKNEINKGLPTTRNVAISHAKGKYIAPIDADDVYVPDTINEFVYAIENRCGDLVYCNYIKFFDENNKIVKYELVNTGLPELYDKEPYYNIIPVFSMFKYEMWKNVGGYNEDLLTYEDWELWIRFYRYGCKSVRINKELFYYRVHGASLLSKGKANDMQLKAKVILNNRLLYNEYHIRFAEKVLAGESELFRDCNVECEMPDLVKLIQIFEKDNPNYPSIVQQINDKYINKININSQNKIYKLEIFTLNISNNKTINILPFYYPNGILTTEYKSEYVGLDKSASLSNFVNRYTNAKNMRCIENGEELISVITPLYNQGHFLEDAIKSIINQTYKNWEMLIVDDCSTDNSLQIARELANKYSDYSISVFSNPHNLKLSATRNAAIKQSNGNYIVPLDADDKLEPTFLAKCMKTMKESGADIVYTDVQEFGEKNELVESIDFDPVILLFFNYITATALIKRNVWEKVGGYDENLPSQTYEDYNLWLNAIKKGFIGKRISEPLFLYRKRIGIGMFEQLMKNENTSKAQLIFANSELFEPEQVHWAEQILAKNPDFTTIETEPYIMPFFEDKNIMYEKLKKRLEKVIRNKREYEVGNTQI